MANNMQRVKVGVVKMVEDDTGHVQRLFYHKAECWMHMVLLPLTSCLPFEACNEGVGRKVKALYRVEMKELTFEWLKKRVKKINAIAWKNKVLVQGGTMALNPKNNCVECLFYDYGQEMKDD